MNKAICGSKESAAPHDELETWKETVLVPTLARYSPNDIYNGDETALFYKSLPHRTYCFDVDKPAGSVNGQLPCTHLLTRLLKLGPALCHELVASGYCTNSCKLQKVHVF